ncbi:hypothetical protein LI187_11085, partial [bacterium 210820-DFI.6.38]|nr:hypothetical protein [bacterium 210820-DFI.6.38]
TGRESGRIVGKVLLVYRLRYEACKKENKTAMWSKREIFGQNCKNSIRERTSSWRLHWKLEEMGG